MRAVNLIPAEERRGAGGAAGRSGGAAYVLLGFLAVLVVLAGMWVSASNQVDDKRAELVQVKAQADAAQARADGLAAYTRFTQLRERRVQTVNSLAASRFDWAHALREVARVIPRNAWLSTMTGTVASGVSIPGASGGSGSLRSALADVPAIEISGCTTSQKQVARMIARMRLIDGVQRVALSSTEKADGGSSGGGSGEGGDCRQGSDKLPKFEIVVFYRASGAAATAAATGAQPAGTTGPTGPTGPAGTTAAATQPVAQSTPTPSAP